MMKKLFGFFFTKIFKITQMRGLAVLLFNTGNVRDINNQFEKHYTNTTQFIYK